ncbi:MAG: nitroreductase family protein [Chloroflexi bacterium]|nr:nitroreductase family protein [Chloroflexota bacterium]
MTIDELTRLVRVRRSIRSFKPDPIPDDYIGKILEVARWAMSGGNGQPWEFIVVKDPDTRARIFELFKAYRQIGDVMENTRAPEMRHPITGTTSQGQPMFKNAPVIIAICGDPRTLQATVLHAQIVGSERETYHMNMANATFLIHLAAASLGLGAQWVSTSPEWEGKLKALLGIPEPIRVPQIAPIGYPDYKPAPPYRRKLEDLAHSEKYDMSRFRTDQDVVKFIIELRKRTTAAYHPAREG